MVCICGPIHAQTTPETYLEIIGKAEYMMDPLNQAKVELFKDDNLDKTLHTRKDGKFSFKLDMNHEYVVKVSKKGFISKKIMFNTQVPEGTEGKWVNEFAIGLLDPCEGVDYELLDKPVDKISYHERKEQFVSNKSYTMKIGGKMEMLVHDIEQCLYNKYDDLISTADQLFKERQYKEARHKYMLATQADPYDRYPRKRIEEIDVFLKDNRLQENKQGEGDENTQQQYEVAIETADRLLQLGENEQARMKYQQAAEFKPGDVYARDKIARLNAKLEQKEQEKSKAGEINRKYTETIKTADHLLALKEYTRARETYQQAMVYKPNEEYPGTKLSEIDRELNRLNENKTEEQAKRTQYNQLIANADKAFENNHYREARTQYQNALQLFPEESYPRSQLGEVEQLIRENDRRQAEQVALDQQYDQAIQRADQQMGHNALAEAQIEYLKASKLKPHEAYPKEQLDRISEQLAMQEKDNMQQQLMEEKYTEAIERADNLYEANNYTAAKNAYQAALGFKPNAEYPKNRIRQIDEILKLLADNKSSQNTPPKSSTGSVENEIKKLYFRNTSEKEKYKRSLKNKYPEGITKEIYKGEFKTMHRYVIIRKDEVHEFREIKYNWGRELYHFDIMTTTLYFRQQTERRKGESYKEIVK